MYVHKKSWSMITDQDDGVCNQNGIQIEKAKDHFNYPLTQVVAIAINWLRTFDIKEYWSLDLFLQ